MFCRKCGSELSQFAVFCSNCGEKTEAGQDTNSDNNQTSYQPVTASPQPSAEKNAWEYFIGAFKKYAVFQGRARRAEYWYFYLFEMIAFIMSQIIDIFVLDYSFDEFGPLYIIVCLVFLLPSWSVMVRRYHDTNRRAWYCLIPIYGFILLFMDGTPGPNRFGEDPKGRNSLSLNVNQ